MVCQPQYLLFCDSNLSGSMVADGDHDPLVGLGRWHFILERLDGPERLEAADSEPQVHRDRIALLAAVRGLEALEHPSHVRLVTTSRYVDRGLRFGLPNWRDSNYRWERFGAFQPIRNSDLWQRIDAALQYHEVACRLLSSGSELMGSLFQQKNNPRAAGRIDRPGSRSGRAVTRPAHSLLPSNRGGLQHFTDAMEAELACGNDLYAENRNNYSSHSSEMTEAKCSVTSLNSSRQPALPITRQAANSLRYAKRQWWEMAAAWVQSVQSPMASGRELTAVPN